MKRNIFLTTFFIGLIFLLNLNFTGSNNQKNNIKIYKDENTMSISNYNDLNITSAKIPVTTHLLLETTSSGLYLVPPDDATDDQIELYYSSDKGETWTQIDIDPSDSSGDNKSRDQKIQAAWHDRANKIIWFVDCDNDETADDFDVWKLDYTASESNPSITEVGTSAAVIANTVFAYDIFMIGSDVFVWSFENSIPLGPYIGIWEVDTFPFVLKDDQTSVGLPDAPYDMYKGTISGTIYYTMFDVAVKVGSTGAFEFKYDNNISTITVGSRLTGYFTSSIGNVQSVAFDNDNTLYFIAEKEADNLNYLVTYSISGDFYTVGGQYNVALMLDRNTASGIQEKAFHLTESKVYRLHPIVAYQLYLISTFNFADIIIGITDTFLICAGGEMYEFEALSDFVFAFDINLGYMRIPVADMIAIDNVRISDGMFVHVTGTFTNAGSTSTQTIFEGYVVEFTEQKLQTVFLESPSRELKQLKPQGDYSGRTDQIIVSILTDYAQYTTVGTLSQGTQMGQIHFDGDKNIFQILNEFAWTDGFIWSITPTGILDYNNGTVDSTINIDETNSIVNVKRFKGPRAINNVIIKGTISGGNQVQGNGAQNLEDQQVLGPNKFERTISHLNTNALCATTEAALLSRWGNQAEINEFNHYDPTIGLIQVGQEITFQNNKDDPNIVSAQRLIKDIIYDAKNQSVLYTVVDQIL